MLKLLDKMNYQQDGHCALGKRRTQEIRPVVVNTREDAEPQEVEISYGGEADLHRHQEDCDKNPGHLEFIPVDQFNVAHLPPGCHDSAIVDLAKTMSDLTVRVSVTYVSRRRPETFPESKEPYPDYENRGSNKMRVGTGWVGKVCRATCKNNDIPSDCEEFQSSSPTSTQFAHIHIQTAAHVVYDLNEGKHTTCHLFFDRDGTPDLCSGVVALSGMSRVESNAGNDWCEMIHLTHDHDLVDRLYNLVLSRESFIKSVENKYHPGKFRSSIYTKQESLPLPGQWRTLVMIVSHPHGCSKQISVGYCADREEKTLHLSQYRYTTATCLGSSGAPVFVLTWGWWELCSTHVHSGTCERDDLNYSCYGPDYSIQ